MAVSERVGFPTSRASGGKVAILNGQKVGYRVKTVFVKRTFSFSSLVRRLSALRWLRAWKTVEAWLRIKPSDQVMWHHIHNARHRQTPNPKHKAPSNGSHTSIQYHTALCAPFSEPIVSLKRRLFTEESLTV
jgi:hypothetical protein